jgi:hypothetical protein
LVFMVFLLNRDGGRSGVSSPNNAGKSNFDKGG